MNSCEMPSSGQVIADSSRVTDAGSRIHRFVPGASPDEGHRWQGVPVQEYKPAADHHCGVSRSVLVGESGEKVRFHVRYFEIAPAGFSTLESHSHEHVVIVLRGVGQVRLADTWHEVGMGDTVYVAPNEIHQLRNAGDEPFGFLCIVDAERDRPTAAPLTP
jgi:quercetin dioxygenase-like cupin family protein